MSASLSHLIIFPGPVHSTQTAEDQFYSLCICFDATLPNSKLSLCIQSHELETYVTYAQLNLKPCVQLEPHVRQSISYLILHIHLTFTNSVQLIE